MAVKFVFIPVRSLLWGFSIFYLLFCKSGFTAFAAEDQLPWSLKPIQRPAPPSIPDKRWPRNPVDNFIFKKLGL